MKKIYYLILALTFIGNVTLQAQYAVLHNFNGTNGQGPGADLTISGNILYGMTSAGGAWGYGCVFSMDKFGGNYRDLFDFNGINGNGPEGSLTLLHGKLYGTSWGGGTNGYGLIFSIDTTGTGYRDLHDFDSANGAFSSGNLTFAGHKFYGMTSQGGKYNDGCVFSMDTDGTGYRDMLDFNDTNGMEPMGSLIIAGKTLYGMTSQELAYAGSVFAIDTDGVRFRDIWKFEQYTNTDGALPQGSLVLANGRLYGMTQQGGAIQSGMIFGVDTDGTGYKDLKDLSCPIGNAPDGSLIISGDTLYGMTSQGGGYVHYGCIFSMDTTGSNYTILHPFNTGVDGSNPYGSLILSGNTLYGMACFGGAFGDGVIFSYNRGPLGVTASEKYNGTSILFPNPNNGKFSLLIRNYQAGTKNQIEIYNVMGKCIHESIVNSSITEFDLGNISSGVYFYKVISLNGALVSHGKVIIQI